MNRFQKSVSSLIFLLITLTFLTGCEIDGGDDDIDRNNYLGTWNCSDSNLKLNYRVEIEVDPSNMAQVLIKNFGGVGEASSAKALVVGSTIHVERDLVGTFWCEGEGSLNGDKIFWSKYNIGEEEKIATFTKLQ
ncbi:hypothetical protein LJB78_00715 [Bacteroidales bacterium OttesenSCG-928-J16]|nr:hypothetical protein [Bacteroidales bacterium OttesenSCG-928-J16]